MAFFVRRPKGRHELRESVHTPKGPRARTLANFSILTDEVLDRAAGRARQPLDREDLWARAVQTGVPVGADRPGPPSTPAEYRRFVNTSRRLGASFSAGPQSQADPGQAVVELARLVDAIASPRVRGPILEFPVLARLVR